MATADLHHYCVDSHCPSNMSSFPSTDHHIYALQLQIHATERQLNKLKAQLQQAEQQAESARHLNGAYRGGLPAAWMDEAFMALQQGSSMDISQKVRQDSQWDGAPPVFAASTSASHSATGDLRWPLEGYEYTRYGRQMIMPEIGLHGQLRVKHAKVLIVGVGGLGCPAAAYLAGAGVGTLGLVDGDTVEESNLHRQIAHSTDRIGMSKTQSAIEYLKSYVFTRKQVASIQNVVRIYPV